MSTTTESQLELFRQAIEALGGQRASAQILNVSERQIRFLLAGDRALNFGVLRDIAAGLIAHADHCRRLERALSPAFSANLTPEQAARSGVADTRHHDHGLDA